MRIESVLQLLWNPLTEKFFPAPYRLLAVENRNILQVLFASVLIVALLVLLFIGSVTLITRLRNSPLLANHALLQVAAIGVLTGLYGMLLVGIAAACGKKIFDGLEQLSVLRSSLIGGGLLMVFSAFYELFFLSRQRASENRASIDLNKELVWAELNSLRSELDPHFVYNTLMPLYYLIKNDTKKAELFTHRLMQVYQYSLQNRQNDYVSLEEELTFARNYFYLLQIRYHDTLSLDVQIKEEQLKMLVLPFSLQTLLENAIKHNEFDEEHPLSVTISVESGNLAVRNNLLRRPESTTSSKIGLKNLRARYRILCNTTISVSKSKEMFVVKLPLLKNPMRYDINNYYRG